MNMPNQQDIKVLASRLMEARDRQAQRERHELVGELHRRIEEIAKRGLLAPARTAPDASSS